MSSRFLGTLAVWVSALTCLVPAPAEAQVGRRFARQAARLANTLGAPAAEVPLVRGRNLVGRIREKRLRRWLGPAAAAEQAAWPSSQGPAPSPSLAQQGPALSPSTAPPSTAPQHAVHQTTLGQRPVGQIAATQGQIAATQRESTNRSEILPAPTAVADQVDTGRGERSILKK